VTTPDQILVKSDERRREVLAPSDGDGLFDAALKVLFRLSIWHSPHRWFVRLILKWKDRLNKEFTEYCQAESVTRSAIDVYTTIFTVMLVLAYIASYLICGAAMTTVHFLISICSIVLPTYRVMEMLAVSASFHLYGPYRPSAPSRGLVLAFIGYGHVILAFAILYLVASDLTSDPFASPNMDKTNMDKTLTSSFINAFYFSVVTVATLGYGDFSPQRCLGKLLVMFEIVIGLVFVVVILQGTFSAASRAQRSNDDVGPPHGA